MGIPEQYDLPDLANLIENVIKRTRQCNIGVGLHLSSIISSDNIHRFYDAGMNWVPYGADIIVMREAMNQHLRHLREIKGDVYSRTGGNSEGVRPCFE
jgi:hypothetical protein